MAGPIVVSNVSVPLIGVVDTAVMGHLDAAYYIGAVAIGAMIFNFLFHLLNCLRMGTTGPTARARGREDWGEVRAMLWRALTLAGAAAALIVLLQGPIAALAFSLVEASAEVEAHARTYFFIRVWTAPANLAIFAIIGWCYGLEDSRTPLVLQVVVNLTNMALDILFVMGFGWGVEGVAIATLIGEYLGLAVAVFAVRRRLKRLPPGRGPVFDRVRLLRLVAINRDITIRSLCVVSANAIFLAESAAAGDTTLAANQILVHFVIFASFGLDGVAHAGEALVGDAVGRRNRAGLREVIRAVLVWSAGLAALMTAVYLAASGLIVAAMTSLPDVRAAAGGWALWAALAPLVAVWAYAYDGIFLGFSATRWMLVTMAIAFAGYVAGLLLLPGPLGNHGLWIALWLFYGLRGVGLALAYPRLRRTFAL
ncbi:MAG: MATE family efflux transporter [Alphaproteobacteria bacterium]|nr:MATE family efflux transporter [Alphaproteobacteria bacterium]